MRRDSVKIQSNNAAKIKVKVQVNDVGSEESITAAKLVVSVGTFTAVSGGAGITPASLISIDKPNDLKLGSDSKLVSQPDDVDFLAYYIMASN